MAILLALFSAFGYALQNTLMVRHTRSTDIPTITAFRGAALGISMLPFLFLSHNLLSAWQPNFLLSIAASGMLGSLGNWSGTIPFRYFSVGVASALTQGALVLASVMSSIFILREPLSLCGGAIVAVILCCTIWLGRHQDETFKSSKRDGFRCLLFSLISGIFSGGAYTFVSIAARETDPYLAAYGFEVSIGCGAFLLCFIRRIAAGISPPPMSKKQFSQVLLASSPTLIGTGCYAAAVSMAPLSLVAAVCSSQLVICTLFSGIINKETIDRLQWMLIVTVMLAIAALNLL